ncbi:hypothetical protein BAUCODRAFT_23182 [Baudoinia panamericana UAMH 10762]|uniref:PHD-type domain-containing protein n=1 Tax=Baudoinia panamericana (strain UAMH 10762) TaxID=717646 RepID=M2NHA2_BAUPA|nr:uncharacterized protein BAUCODRAFT_23182 [Baudoinia panamericana UAMH 10762]EMC98405.1 hypothetical protein BAUCODRAFT_23182 [Baudoinia panamericana UAMH 10762]
MFNDTDEPPMKRQKTASAEQSPVDSTISRSPKASCMGANIVDESSPSTGASRLTAQSPSPVDSHSTSTAAALSTDLPTTASTHDECTEPSSLCKDSPRPTNFAQRISKASRTWTPPAAASGRRLPPISNFALLMQTVPKSSKAVNEKMIYCICKTKSSTINLAKCIQCCNINCGKWFHLKCVDLPEFPQGRYGWSCEECDPDDKHNGLFVEGGRVDYHGEDYDGRQPYSLSLQRSLRKGGVSKDSRKRKGTLPSLEWRRAKTESRC